MKDTTTVRPKTMTMNSVRSTRLMVGLGLLAVVARWGVATAAEPVNKMCPVMTLEEADPTITVEYKGKTIAFCCRKCVRKFEADPERYLVNLAAFNEGGDQQAEPTPAETSADEGNSKAGDDSVVAPTQEPANTPPPSPTGNAAKKVPANQTTRPSSREESESGDEDEGAESLPKFVAWLGRFHPAAVNFPIAMMIGAAIAELLRMVTGRGSFKNAGRFCLWIAGLGAVVAGPLGWFFGGFHWSDPEWVMTTHRWVGTGTVLWIVATLVVGERSYRRPDSSSSVAYRVMLAVGSLAVGASGFLGGSLIYGIRHYAW